MGENLTRERRKDIQYSKLKRKYILLPVSRRKPLFIIQYILHMYAYFKTHRPSNDVTFAPPKSYLFNSSRKKIEILQSLSSFCIETYFPLKESAMLKNYNDQMQIKKLMVDSK